MRPVINEKGEEMLVSVPLPGAEAWVKVWNIEVGRVRLFLLDSNVPRNESIEYREITDQLYGGDFNKRIRQEVVLGIGGLRALKKLGIQPTVYHMNEGHSAFLAIERIRVLMEEHNSRLKRRWKQRGSATSSQLIPACLRESTCSTTAWCIVFFDDCDRAGFPFEKLLELGRRNMQDPAERFSMAVLALRASAFRNAVSVLHRWVSQEMFQHLWPKLPTSEVPITSITNGVHAPTWVNGDLAGLYDQYLQPDWRERLEDTKMWELATRFPTRNYGKCIVSGSAGWLLSYVNEARVARCSARDR